MIIFFGPAGSGKSTQGRTIADKYGWRWLSVGQVLRDTGRFDEILKQGKLVDDETVVQLMSKEIEFAEAEGMEVVLDGYPRDTKQTEIMLADENQKFFNNLKAAIILDVPKEELWKRIEERGREDDTKEVVERRFDIFEQNICSIIPLLEEKGVRIEHVDGVGTFEEVTDRIVKIIQEIEPNSPEVWDDEVVDSIENDALEREKSYGE
ncbi:nucleoside monophosphate kinase [Candidatus Saccharibacteria bacterium]|nr:nucleoside monophosphate kinase [Candidatus Saccharibacteria bacterium]